MTTARPIGLSILSAAGLIGTTKLFSRGGAYRAARAATRLGFGLQLLPFGPLPGLTESFQDFVERLNPASVLAFEGRWGDADPWHAWRHANDGVAAIAAYYALFPIRHDVVVRRCQELHHRFPDAVAIDCPVDGASQEVSPQTCADLSHWTRLVQIGTPLVLDTYHIHGSWQYGDGDDLLGELSRAASYVSVVHVQIRAKGELDKFIGNAPCCTVTTLLTIREMISEQTPVIIELPPWLVTEERMMLMRKRILSLLG